MSRRKSAGGRERTASASLLYLEATVCVVMVTAERRRGGRRGEDGEEDREGGLRGGPGKCLLGAEYLQLSL